MNNDDSLFQRLTKERDVLSVSQLNARARSLLEDAKVFFLCLMWNDIWCGENRTK